MRRLPPQKDPCHPSQRPSRKYATLGSAAPANRTTIQSFTKSDPIFRVSTDATGSVLDQLISWPKNSKPSGRTTNVPNARPRDAFQPWGGTKRHHTPPITTSSGLAHV